MDPVEHLPVELVRSIIELAAATNNAGWRRKRELRKLFRSLALVSHGWEELSREYLYAEIALESEEQADSFVETLDLHTDRAALVKTLELSYNPFAEDEPWRKNLVLYGLKHCVKLGELRMLGEEGKWSNAWDAALAHSSLHTLQLHCISISDLSATFSSLRILSLSTVTLPQDIDTFSKSFPSLSELSMSFDADGLLPGEARAPSNLHFVVAMAPQLVTLRLDNGSIGVPISLIQHLITIGARLERLDSSIISEHKLPPPALPPCHNSAHLPPLELHFIFHPWLLNHLLSTDELPVQERLWAVFESRDGGAVQAISALRRVERVVLEPWLTEQFPEGVARAMEKMKELFAVEELSCKGFHECDWAKRENSARAKLALCSPTKSLSRSPSLCSRTESETSAAQHSPTPDAPLHPTFRS